MVSEHKIYKAVMLDEVPNFGFVFGYTNASWTLKADISSLYFTQVSSDWWRSGHVTSILTCDWFR